MKTGHASSHHYESLLSENSKRDVFVVTEKRVAKGETKVVPRLKASLGYLFCYFGDIMELKETLLMPKTGFEMRGNLTSKEPKMIAKWDEQDIYSKMNANREGCEEFLLHDGPPYANGDIHCGHMLNRLLKDFIIRYKNMCGYKTPFIFGWDTHGLPIEVKVTKSGINRKAMSVPAFRDLCKEYALKQVAHQKEQIHRLGCLGDYEHPYLTLLPEYEARQIDVFAKMALKGIIYKGVKPVYWSPSSESALAEAEVEYQDVTAKTMYVAFSVKDGKGKLDKEDKIIIWTTTPWTIPHNQAVALNPKFTYGLYKTNKGNFLFASSLEEKIKETLELSDVELIKSFHGTDLEGIVLNHPLYDDRTSLVILATYVTDSDGTGCVHIAPDFGTDDFNAALKYGLKPLCPIDEKGIVHMKEGDPINNKFYDDTNDIVISLLEEKGSLLKEIDLVHSYPHDWRTHKPVIFRATPQWFCSIEPIKEDLLKAISQIKWMPSWGEEKMVNMIKGRSDWCISRQRSWGVPLPIIYNEDDSPIIEKEVFDHIRNIIAKEGSNAWFSKSATELLPPGYKNSKSPNGKFRKETDIMDVWFDSGSSWNGVLEERKIGYPASLYLEGNDQYRGWFNASLILSVAAKGEASFKSCLTHGWVMDESWKKMSKSAGNGIDPNKVANQFGADLLRLWAASVSYESDVRISEKIISSISDQYRKIRNTFKFLLGNLQECVDTPYYGSEKAPKLYPVDEIILLRLEEVKNAALKAYETYAFSTALGVLTNFMVELSGFYLDISKDVLYCEKAYSPRREAVLYVLYKLTKELCLLYNPILSFTMDEVYSFIPSKNKKDSPQLEDMPKESHVYGDKEKAITSLFFATRDIVLKALEESRTKGEIGASNEAKVVLSTSKKDLYNWLNGQSEEERARLFGISELILLEGEDKVTVSKSELPTCERCRLHKNDLVLDKEGHHLCSRCLEAISKEEN